MLEGFLPVVRTRASNIVVARVRNGRELSIPIGLQRNLGMEIPENHCQLFYNPQTRQVAVQLIAHPEPQVQYAKLHRGDKVVRKGVFTGFSIALGSLMESFRVRLNSGEVKILSWDKDARVMVIDLSSVVQESDRPIREIKAREVKALKG